MKGTPFSGMLVADAVATKPTDEEVVSLVNELKGVPHRTRLTCYTELFCSICLFCKPSAHPLCVAAS